MDSLGGAVMKERWSKYLCDFVPKWRHTPGWEEFNEWRTPDPADGYRRMAERTGFRVISSQVCCIRRGRGTRNHNSLDLFLVKVVLLQLESLTN